MCYFLVIFSDFGRGQPKKHEAANSKSGPNWPKASCVSILGLTLKATKFGIAYKVVLYQASCFAFVLQTLYDVLDHTNHIFSVRI